MKTGRPSVASVRREQIVDAATAIIAEQGIQNLSLSEIEEKARMSRGQLIYYFKTKEQILLAVFDRMIERMRQRAAAGEGPVKCHEMVGHGWDHLKAFLNIFLLNPPEDPTFHALQYTFLSQIGHRDDFRERLASLYEEWRQHAARDVAEETGPAGRTVSPRTVSTLVQAILHGLAIQRAADPDAYNREEMLTLCLELFGSHLRPHERPTRRRPSRRGARPNPKGLNHEKRP
jgi:AcrR family transcriptional regulator